jgi:hypothetical protein
VYVSFVTLSGDYSNMQMDATLFFAPLRLCVSLSAIVFMLASMRAKPSHAKAQRREEEGSKKMVAFICKAL